MHIERDDLSRPAIHALLDEHLRSMRAWSPPESVYALDLDQLRQPGITFWSAWDDAGVLLGCGALKELDAAHGELKSMRTPEARRGRGAGRAPGVGRQAVSDAGPRIGGRVAPIATLEEDP